MYEEDLWSTLYIILIFVVFISGLALRAAARSLDRRDNAYEPWHGQLDAAEGKPRHDGKDISKTSSGWVSGALLSVVALAAIAAVAIFFWPGWPNNKLILQVGATLRDTRADQQQTTIAIEAINDRPAVEKFLAQTPQTKAINESHAAEDQFIALSARLSTLQEAMTRILREDLGLAEQLRRTLRDNVGFAEQLRTMQTQMAQDNVLVAERLKALTQMAARPGVVAMGSEERERPRRTIKRKLPQVGGAARVPITTGSAGTANRRTSGVDSNQRPSN
jgi:hypothetical protein